MLMAHCPVIMSDRDSDDDVISTQNSSCPLPFALNDTVDTFGAFDAAEALCNIGSTSLDIIIWM